jgi:hypothetical protein
MAPLERSIICTLRPTRLGGQPDRGDGLRGIAARLISSPTVQAFKAFFFGCETGKVIIEQSFHPIEK